ncbi:MAG TPA: M15 family metallopeptidase [Acidimicrobiales bacterium]
MAARCGLLLMPALLAGSLVAMAGPARAQDAPPDPTSTTTTTESPTTTTTQLPVPPPPPSFAPPDQVSVSMSRELDPRVRDAALRAAAQVGATATVLETFTVGLTRMARGDQTMLALPLGWRIPMTTTIVDPAAAAVLMGQDVGDALAAGQVVFGSIAAQVRAALAGDFVELRAVDGTNRTVQVGLVAEHERVRSSELVMSVATARALGYARPTRLVLWGFASREAMDSALAGVGMPNRSVRVAHSWDPRSPDDTLSTARTKAALGEFPVANSRGRLVVDRWWFAANMRRVRFRIGPRTAVTWCHRLVAPDVQAAFDEIAAARLTWRLDVANIRRYGGCYGAREVRAVGSTTGGQLSRHTWGMAFDLNTRQNCMGCRPRLDCRIVRIFRAHGFAWGGNFLTPDGMHFEWVGERRDQIPSLPGELCPNIVPAPSG